MNPDKQGKDAQDSMLPHFECTKCGACCRNEHLLVTVTGSDVVKIASVLGLGPDELLKALDFYIMSNGVLTPVGLERIPSVATERGLAYIALKKMENGDCIFLKENLCMIHPVRPLVCSSFPFVFTESKGQRNWGLSAKKEICPGLGKGTQMSQAAMDEIADTILSGIQKFKEFTQDWNANQNSPTAIELLKVILTDSRFYD